MSLRPVVHVVNSGSLDESIAIMFSDGSKAEIPGAVVDQSILLREVASQVQYPEGHATVPVEEGIIKNWLHFHGIEVASQGVARPESGEVRSEDRKRPE